MFSAQDTNKKTHNKITTVNWGWDCGHRDSLTKIESILRYLQPKFTYTKNTNQNSNYCKDKKAVPRNAQLKPW